MNPPDYNPRASWLRTGTKMLTLEVAIIALFVVPAGIYAATTIGKSVTTGTSAGLGQALVGWWSFDGSDMLQNVADRSGSGKTGQLSGFTSTTTVRGPVGQALEFDGSNDIVELPNISSAITGNNITVAAWVKSDLSSGDARSIITEKYAGDGNVKFMMALGDGTFPTVFVTGFFNGTWRLAEDTTPVIAGRWYHVVGTYDGANIRLYKDGVNVVTTAYTGSLPSASEGWHIGKRHDATNGNHHWDGLIDDVRVYNKTLTADEVKKLYGIGATTHIAATPDSGLAKDGGLIGHWTFDGADLVQNVRDASTVGRNGFLDESPNNPPATTTIPGKIGQALSFDGADDGVTFPTKALNNLSAGSATFFIQMDTIEQSIPIYEDGSGLNNFAANTPSSSPGTFVFNIGNNTSRSSTSRLWRAGQWYHVAFTWGSEMKIYVDGVLDTTIAVSGGTLDRGGHGTQFGRAVFGAGPTVNNHFDGALDDVRIYNRTLTDAEVARIAGVGQTTKIAVSPNTGQTSAAGSGLVAHWTFDGPSMLQNVADRSGNGYTGRLAGFTSTTTSVGKYGQALTFDGVDDYINMGNAVSLTGSHTISAWIYFTTNPLVTDGWIVERSDASGQNYWFWWNGTNRFALGDNTLVFGHSRSGGNDEKAQAWTPMANRWYHVVGVYSSAAQTNTLYVDGAAIGSGGATNGIIDGADNFEIGRRPVTADDYFPGRIDDVRIYNRAFSAADVLRLYQTGL